MFYYTIVNIILTIIMFQWVVVAEDNIDEYKAAPESSLESINNNKNHVSSKFMAVTADPRATLSAVKILESGGSAIDAAISAQMVLNLVEPQSSGIGGGAFIMYYDNKTKNLSAWDGREKAPLNFSEKIFLNQNGKRKGFVEAVSGGLAVGAPSLISLLEKVHKKYGVIEWNLLFDDAIKYSFDGFIVGKRLESLIKRAPHLKNSITAKDYFKIGDGGLKEGELKKNIAFGQTLQKIKNAGSRALIDGLVPESIIKVVNNHSSNPGNLTLEDFKNINPEIQNPVCSFYRHWKICGMGPPSSGGITVLQILGILNNFDLKKMDEELVWHLFLEATKLAYSDRNYYIADIDFIDFPMKDMLSNSYLKDRSKLIKFNNVLNSIEPGEFEKYKTSKRGSDSISERPSTTHISIIDMQGNAISMTSSIEFMFGSGLMSSGFLLNNQMTDFSFYPKDEAGNLIANRPQAGKKPRSSMSPTVVFDPEGNIKMILGSPGGSRIICYVAASLIRIIDMNIDPMAVTKEPNICNRGGKTTLEIGEIGDSLEEALKLKGHEIQRKNMTSGLHIIYKGDSGSFYGIADQRREGAAYGL